MKKELSTGVDWQALYEAHKQDWFQKKDTVRVWKLSSPNKSELEEVKRKLEQGMQFDKAELQIMDANTRRTDEEETPRLTAIIDRLAIGQYSEVFQENGAWHLVRIIEKVPGGIQPYDEVKELVKSLWLDHLYQDELNKRVQSAKVEMEGSNEP